MKLFIFLVICATFCIEISSDSANNCFYYACVSSLDDACAKVDPDDNKKINVMTCGSGEQCKVKDGKPVCEKIPDPDPVKLLPGYKPTGKNTCGQGSAVDGYCRGKKVDEKSCTAGSTSSSCDVGLFCNHESVCKAFLAKGADCKDEPAGCPPSQSCYTVTKDGKTTSTCIDFFSLAKDETSGSAMLCQSGYIEGTKCADVPVKGDGFSKWNPIDKDLADLCVYKDKKLPGQCTSSGKKDQAIYCVDYADLDKQYAGIKAYLTKITNENCLQSNGYMTDMQIDKECDAAKKAVSDAAYSLADMASNNPDCMKFTTPTLTCSGSQIIFGILSILAIVLFI